MDYFDILLAKKLNGSGGDITIEDLTITANGEYRAPSGKAYGKVTANVPAPSNALFKQTLSNLPSPIATFVGADAPLDSLKASIVGVQSGSGDPSPTNIRPISGWSEAIITNTDDLTDPTVTRTVTISFGQYVYGGYLNVSTGLLTITHIVVEKTWGEYTSKTTLGNYKRGTISLAQRSVRNDPNAISNIAPWMLNYTSDTLHFYVSEQSANVFLPVDTSNDVVISIRYELATPQTIQLTPTQVRTLLGNNNISVNCGEVMELKFYSETP